jgi:hypothetical protein
LVTKITIRYCLITLNAAVVHIIPIGIAINALNDIKDRSANHTVLYSTAETGIVAQVKIDAALNADNDACIEAICLTSTAIINSTANTNVIF